MNRQHTRARRAFTLVELLAVVAIIMLLASLVLFIARGVVDSQKSAATESYVQVLKLGAENFKVTFGEYPTHPSGSTDSESWKRTLYGCLTGYKVLRVSEQQIQLANYDQVNTKTKALRKPFVTESQLKINLLDSGDMPEEAERYFLDAWENPFAYRYNIIESGAMGKAWGRPDFLLISPGTKFHDPVRNTDYFSDGMEMTGFVSDTYFDDEYRASNITNFPKR
jgi:prepilin-type N-terminal cleavage/methylation domain-containing protein